MLDKLTASIDYHGKALELRAQRQQVLSGNIANADTPGFKARDMDFGARLAAATHNISDAGHPGNTDKISLDPSGSKLATATSGMASPGALATTQRGHRAGLAGNDAAANSLSTLKYRAPQQAALDGNTVDLDMERANFADNSMRYEASLRFINGSVRKILTAIRGE